MQHLSVLIKPASSSCNMRCQYCFYDDVSNHREIKNHGIMKESVMKKMIDRIFMDLELKSVHFAFQGGEPTMAGIEFFENFVSYVDKKKDYVQVEYSIQSNGYVLDSRWIQLFKDYDFLVGISLDGYQSHHDSVRFDARHHETFSTIIDHIHQLRDNHIHYNILTVLTKQLALHPQKVYEFYKQNHFQYIQFIPCLPSLDKEEDEYSLTPELFYDFYKTLYKLWSNDIKKGHYMSISLFDNIMAILHHQYPSQCGFVGKCQIQYVIESQGNVYPCDFYVLDEYCLGNAQYDDFNTMPSLRQAQLFLQDNEQPQLCQKCKYLKICYGQCKRQRGTFLNQTMCGYQKLLDDILEEMIKL